jgi:hypothetical protein
MRAWGAFARPAFSDGTADLVTRTEAAFTDCHNKSPEATSMTVATAGQSIQPVRGEALRARCSA